MVDTIINVEKDSTKVIVRLLRESWFPILLTVIVWAYSIGVVYTKINNDIAYNRQTIDQVREGYEYQVQDLKYMIQRLENKLDDVNKYLRDKK